MADRYWVGTTTSWNTASNWASTSGGAGGAGVPTSADAVIFDGGGTGNCTLDVNTADIVSFTVSSGYTGTLDFDAYNVTVSGNFIVDGGTLLFGSGTHTFSAGFDVLHAGASSDYETSTIVFDGTTSNPLTWMATSKLMYNCSITGTVTMANIAYSSIRVTNSLDISGTYTHNSTIFGRYLLISRNASVAVTGTINGLGGISIKENAIITNATGIWQIANTLLNDSGLEDSFITIGGGTYDTTLTFDTTNSAYTPYLLFTGNTTIKNISQAVSGSAGVRFDLATNNVDLEIAGDVSLDSLTTWIKGTGTITLSGSANQSIDFDGESVEDIVIDKTAGTVTLTGGVVTDSLTLTSGTLDCGSQTLETVGNFTMAAGTTVTET